jgi:hypothetical protein
MNILKGEVDGTSLNFMNANCGGVRLGVVMCFRM